RAAGDLLEPVDGGDVRVVERGEGQRLVAEAGQRFRAHREPRRQHLEGHLALEPRVAREPHLTHAACAELADDLVGAEPARRRLAGGPGHVSAAVRPDGRKVGRSMALESSAVRWPARGRGSGGKQGRPGGGPGRTSWLAWRGGSPVRITRSAEA